MPLIIDNPTNIGSCLESDCSAKKVMKTSQWGKPSHSVNTNTCLLFIYPHLAHSLPVYGIISRCPIDRIWVASDNAITTSWFWFASRTCPIWQFNSSLGLFKNHLDLRWIEPTSEFPPGFRFKFASPYRNTGVPKRSINNQNFWYKKGNIRKR